MAEYQIEGPGGGVKTWDITVVRPIEYLTGDHVDNFARDMRFGRGYRTLREAQQACKEHAELEAARAAGFSV